MKKKGFSVGSKRRNIAKRKKSDELSSPNLAIPREALRVAGAWIKHGVFGFPLNVGKAIMRNPAIVSPLNDDSLFDIVGDSMLKLFDAWGPVYGKMGQVSLSRLPPDLQKKASDLGFTRLYDSWPELPFAEIKKILDREIPKWRSFFEVEAHPIGVASIAQVHNAVDSDGDEWVIKIIKPLAKKRLLESVAALEQMVSLWSPLAVTLAGKRYLREIQDLCDGFRRELSLRKEKETILRVRAKLEGRKQDVLVIPDVLDEFTTENVMVLERFRGTNLSDVVTGKVKLESRQRQKLARKVLQELLIQVFELGLFHADPHAGNLILMDDGSVGLFDWGLAGELMNSDRKHIAAILKAVIALDLERLIDALIAMADESGQTVTRAEVKKELSTVINMIKEGKKPEGKKASFQKLFEACMNAADRLGIDVPDGLLLMAKSLITIDGLAKGIDPKVSMLRIASPVLFRASRPGFKDFVALGKKLPKIAEMMFKK